MEILDTAAALELYDPRVWVAGDWHGNAAWVGSLFPAMRRHDAQMATVLQLGDYGFDHHERDTTHAVDYWARRAGIQNVLVTLGNHEDWGTVSRAHAVSPGEAIRVSEVVWLLPRPFRLTIMGRSVLSLGGASSVDRSWRTEGRDYWPDELITEQMERDAIDGGAVDILLTHEAPLNGTAEAAAVLATNPHGFPDDALAVSAAQRERIERVRRGTQPKIHFHGHIHVHGERTFEDGSRVFALNRDTKPGHVGVLDMATLQFEPLAMSAIHRR